VRAIIRRLLAAVAFLTRVPIRTPFTAEDVGRSALFFPLVGLGIGFVQLGVWQLSTPYLTSLLSAILVVAVSAWLTRALHLDGLADFFDGLGGGRTKDDVLRIMKDSRVGSFGAIALVFALLAKIAAVDALVSPEALVLAPALARWTPVALSYALPYARSGVVAPAGTVGKLELAGATVMAAGFVAFWGGIWLAGTVIFVSAAVGLVSKRKIHGVTGDVLGANIEIAEVAALIVATV